MLRNFFPTESPLAKLCTRKDWEQVKYRVKSTPEEAKPNSSAHRGIGSTALSIAVRGGAPYDTIVALTEADVEQLVRVRHSRRGTVLHEAVTHGASMKVLSYFIRTIVRYEKERRWISRGELKPISFDFSSEVGGGIVKRGGGGAMVGPFKSEPKEDFTSPLSSSSPYRFHNHTTLFNTTDDLGRTVLHCIMIRICRDINNHSGRDDATNVIDTLIQAFPPAVGKIDHDGHTPLDLALMTQSERRNDSFRDMEVEIRLLGLVRLMIGVYPLAACLSVNSARATFTPKSISDVLGRITTKGSHDHSSMLVVNRRRAITDAISGNIVPTSLSHALMYGRHLTTVQLLLEASKLAQTSWHTGHLRDWSEERADKLRTVDNQNCMAVVSHDHEVPLHIAVTMRASEEIVSLLLHSAYQAAAIADRCGLTPICWAWIRFVIDRGEVGTTAHYDRTTKLRQFPVRVSQRRFMPNNYVRLHEAATNEISDATEEHTTVNAVQQQPNHAIHHPVNNSHFDSDSSESTKLWSKLSALLPCAARVMAAHLFNQTLTTSLVQTRWSTLHAASFIDCPRAVVLMAADRGCRLDGNHSDSSSSRNSIREKDIHGNLPIHYAAARSGYVKRNIPVGAMMGSQKNIMERSVVFDLLPRWPQGARVTNGKMQLPLHLAIEEEKQSRAIRKGEERETNVSQFETCIAESPVLCLFNSYPEGLERRDGVTKLYPFMQAALGDSADLDMVFILLKKNPAIIK